MALEFIGNDSLNSGENLTAVNAKEVERKTLSTYVFFTDGSSQPNPGYAGSGIFGYEMKPNPRPKNINYPVKSGYQFTTQGIVPRETNKDDPFDIVKVFDRIVSFPSDYVTNNYAELYATTEVLEILDSEIDNVKEVIIYTDSKYVVNSVNDYIHKWVNNGWKTSKGVDVSNKDVWLRFTSLYNRFTALGIGITVKWVKGHDENVGNNIVDMYAVIGTNNSRNQFEEGYNPLIGNDDFDGMPYNTITPLTTFRKECDERHFLYDYTNIVFGSENCNDSNSIYLTSPYAEEDVGKRDLLTSYMVLKGKVPKAINDLKYIYRDIPRDYNITCKINLDTLRSDKLLMRLVNAVGFRSVTSKVRVAGQMNLIMFSKDRYIVEPLDHKYPYKLEMNDTLTAMENAVANLDYLKENGELIDLTELFIKDGKSVVTSRDKHLDISDLIQLKDYDLVSNAIIHYGKDTPPYSTIRTLEKSVTAVNLYVDTTSMGNLATFIFIISYKDSGVSSHIAQTNLLGKYLIRPKGLVIAD